MLDIVCISSKCLIVPPSELYWQAMSSVIPDNTNDQARLNWALEEMKMEWENSHCDVTRDTMVGEGREGFRAAVLPVKDVCRQTCSKRMIRVSACHL